MKSTTKTLATMLFLITLSSSCASLAKVSVPKLELRTLRLSDKVAGFEYRYCKKRKFFSGKCKKWHTDYYDLKDPAVRDKLKAMGFVLKVRKKP